MPASPAIRLLVPVLALASLLAAPAVGAQEPTAPPPPSLGTGEETSRYHELLPEIGRIGSQVAVEAGAGWNPYGAGQGLHLGGYVDLPLFKAAGGKVSYELLVDVSLGERDSVFGLTQKQRILQFSAVGLKYTYQGWDDRRLRPYLYAGGDFDLVFTRAEVERLTLPSALSGFLDPALVAALEEAADFDEGGSSRLELGGHAGAGLEWRFSRGLSLAVDYRFSVVGEDEHMQAVSGALGFHW